MNAYTIKYSDGRQDDASTLEEAIDSVRDLYPDALLGDNRFFVPYGDAMATVAVLTVVAPVDPNAN
jgi:hypothetical protein